VLQDEKGFGLEKGLQHGRTEQANSRGPVVRGIRENDIERLPDRCSRQAFGQLGDPDIGAPFESARFQVTPDQSSGPAVDLDEEAVAGTAAQRLDSDGATAREQIQESGVPHPVREEVIKGFPNAA